MPGYPNRPVPRNEDAAKACKKRTLPNLYQQGLQFEDAGFTLETGGHGSVARMVVVP